MRQTEVVGVLLFVELQVPANLSDGGGGGGGVHAAFVI